MRGHEDKIDGPSVSTYPSGCADPCLEMVKSLPYLDSMSECFHFFFWLPQSRAKLMPREQRLVFRARPRRLDQEPKEQMHWKHSPIGILRQMYIGTEI